MRVCDLTGKGTRMGASRSYSCVRTPRRFVANLQWKVFPCGDRKIRLRVSASVIRTINRYEDFQSFFKAQKDNLSLSLRASKRLRFLMKG